VTAQAREQALAEQRAGIDQLSVADMEAVLASREMTSLRTLGALLSSAGPYPRREQIMARFCAALEQRGVALDVVVGPVPRQTLAYSAALDNPDLPPSLDDLGRSLEAWLPCARRVIARPAQGWGLDLRHYINRMAEPDYPYEIWDSPAAFAGYADGLDRQGRVTLFDGNHLNLAGATVFTAALVQALD
jgi:hypothetical protein